MRGGENEKGRKWFSPFLFFPQILSFYIFSPAAIFPLMDHEMLRWYTIINQGVKYLKKKLSPFSFSCFSFLLFPFPFPPPYTAVKQIVFVFDKTRDRRQISRAFVWFVKIFFRNFFIFHHKNYFFVLCA